jgi:acyl-CoA thioester hydrolase
MLQTHRCPPSQPWCLQRRVLPQHTDHAGVMWHGAYVAWLEEGRVEALARVGLDYAELSRRGLEMPVVSLAIHYHQPLRHGDQVTLLSEVLAFKGVKLPWACRFLGPEDRQVAMARVELVLVSSAGGQAPKVLRRYPEDLARAVARLQAGPGGIGVV